MDQGAFALISDKAVKTSERYYGQRAKEYDKQRSWKPKWKAEEKAVRDLLDPLKDGTRILDIPCGTGRFIPLYVRFDATCLDISNEMLAQVFRNRVPFTTSLVCSRGDIFDIDLPDKSIDVSLSIRFMNLIKPDDMKLALKELARVTRATIAFTMRIGDVGPGHYHSPQKLPDVRSALPRWNVTARAMHEESYLFVVCHCDGSEIV